MLVNRIWKFLTKKCESRNAQVLVKDWIDHPSDGIVRLSSQREIPQFTEKAVEIGTDPLGPPGSTHMAIRNDENGKQVLIGIFEGEHGPVSPERRVLTLFLSCVGKHLVGASLVPICPVVPVLEYAFNVFVPGFSVAITVLDDGAGHGEAEALGGELSILKILAVGHSRLYDGDSFCCGKGRLWSGKSRFAIVRHTAAEFAKHLDKLFDIPLHFFTVLFGFC